MGRNSKKNSRFKARKAQDSQETAASSSSNSKPKPPALPNRKNLSEEKRLESLLSKKLDLIYKHSVDYLGSIGFTDLPPFELLLSNDLVSAPHDDPFANIVCNASKYHLACHECRRKISFPDLRLPEECSRESAIKSLVTKLLRYRPKLSRLEALRRLFKSELNVHFAAGDDDEEVRQSMANSCACGVVAHYKSGFGTRSHSEDSQESADKRLIQAICNAAQESGQELLFGSLDTIYTAAIARLVVVGLDETLPRRSVLSNGHFYRGAGNVIFNVISNANAVFHYCVHGRAAAPPAFPDLRRLGEHGVRVVVDVIQRLRPKLTRRQVLECIYRSEFSLMDACRLPLPGCKDDSGATRLQSMNSGDYLDLVCKTITVCEEEVGGSMRSSEVSKSVMELESLKKRLEELIDATEKRFEELGDEVNKIKEEVARLIRNPGKGDDKIREELKVRTEEVANRVEEFKRILKLWRTVAKVVEEIAEVLQKLIAIASKDAEAKLRQEQMPEEPSIAPLVEVRAVSIARECELLQELEQDLQGFKNRYDALLGAFNEVHNLRVLVASSDYDNVKSADSVMLTEASQDLLWALTEMLSIS